MPADALLYLSDREVMGALGSIDIVKTVRAALIAHGRGDAVAPTEAHLAWEHRGQRSRSLSMPGLIDGRPGVKLINANPTNPCRGLPRASGLIVLLDPHTARPICILQAARISCLRTAAVTAIAADLLAVHPIRRLALLGAGALARCHLELLSPRLPELSEIRLHDLDPARADAVAASTQDPRIAVSDSAEHAIRGAELVVPVTTTTSGYIRHEWLTPGALLVNVSLDDPLPEVILQADKLFVDDLALIAADDQRLLGRMLHHRHVRGGSDPTERPPPVTGELGELLLGKREGRTRNNEIILVNPFGLAIEDIAIALHVYRHALEYRLGSTLNR